MVKLQAIKDLETDYTNKQAAIDLEINAIGKGFVPRTFAADGTVSAAGTAATEGQLFLVAQQRAGLEAIIEGL